MQHPHHSLVLSYLDLRKSVGMIGMILPFVLVSGKFFFESSGILDSISGYYYSVMGDVFVGSLCAIGVFLLSYRGYDRQDNLVSALAGISAIGVGLIPTTAEITWSGIGHLIFATFFFSALAYFALVLFRKTHPNKKTTTKKQIRNMMYAICGWIIVICIVLIALVTCFLRTHWIQNFHPVFWLEASAIIAFGFSWFVKGEAILKDE